MRLQTKLKVFKSVDTIEAEPLNIYLNSSFTILNENGFCFESFILFGVDILLRLLLYRFCSYFWITSKAFDFVHAFTLNRCFVCFVIHFSLFVSIIFPCAFFFFFFKGRKKQTYHIVFNVCICLRFFHILHFFFFALFTFINLLGWICALRSYIFDCLILK